MGNFVSVKALTVSSAVFFAVVSIICGLFFMFAPETGIALFKSLAHSSIEISAKAVTFTDLLVSAIEAGVLGGIAGFVFARLYNSFVGK